MLKLKVRASILSLLAAMGPQTFTEIKTEVNRQVCNEPGIDAVIKSVLGGFDYEAETQSYSFQGMS